MSELIEAESMTDPAPTLFTRRVFPYPGPVGLVVTVLDEGGNNKHLLCPSCSDLLYWDVNHQWACKCGYRTKAREEIP